MAPPPPVDWFALAALRSEGLPTQVAIRQRLAQLQAELARSGVRDDDPAIPAMIAALFPPGALAPPTGGGPKEKTDETTAEWPTPTATELSPRFSWLRRFNWKRALKHLRLLAPLLFLLLVADRPPVVSPERKDPPPSKQSVLQPPPKTDGHWQDQPKTKVERPNPKFYRMILVYIVVGAALWLLAILLLRERRRRLKRDANPDVDPVIDLALRVGRANLFAGPRFDRALRQLRLRRAVPSQRLDIRRSLRATIAQAGLPALHYGVRLQRPDYVILSDRTMPGDHLPEIGRALRDRLAAAQVDVQHYEFTGAPWRVRLDHPTLQGGFESADAVMARHVDARVMLSAESYELADEFVHGPGWIEAIGGSHRPMLLNPRESEHWHAPENLLADAGLAMTEAGGIDHRLLARIYADDGPQRRGAHHESAEEADLAAFLTEERDTLLSDTAPDQDMIDAILGNLERHWLSPMEMRWLRTLALFPVIHPALTYFAGLAVFGTDSVPTDSYLKLVRLPWFRVGSMPDWMRHALVKGMDPQDFEQAKRIVQAFFSREAAKVQGAADILKLCLRAGRKRDRDRFAQGIRRSDIPALKDGLIQGAFLLDDPAQVEFLSAIPRARDLPWWIEVGLLAAIALAGFLLFSEARTITDTVQPLPKWVQNVDVNDPSVPGIIKKPGPALASVTQADPKQHAVTVTNLRATDPVLPAGPNLGGPLTSRDRIVYAQIANPEDRQAASRVLAELANSAVFQTNDLVVAGIEYRENSPSKTEVRCFNDRSCKVAHAVGNALSRQGIAVIVSTLNNSKLGDAGNPLEIWFADKDLENTPEPDPALVQTDIEPCGPYTVFFEWDSTAITPEAATILDNVATKCSRTSIMLAGHTDRSGSTAYNQALSVARASSVRSYLRDRGIPYNAMTVRGYGETRPRVPTADGVREIQNRRVESTSGSLPSTRR